jgi:hypothetical protein
MKYRRASPRTFVEAWQTSATPVESAGKLGLPVGRTLRLARFDREAGVRLKSMACVGQAASTAARLLGMGGRPPI